MTRTWTTGLIWIGLALLLVVANGFFVAAEFALVKIRGARMAQLVRVDTVAGLVLYALGKVPAVGDRVELDGVAAEALEVKQNRAMQLRPVKTTGSAA